MCAGRELAKKGTDERCTSLQQTTVQREGLGCASVRKSDGNQPKASASVAMLQKLRCACAVLLSKKGRTHKPTTAHDGARAASRDDAATQIGARRLAHLRLVLDGFGCGLNFLSVAEVAAALKRRHGFVRLYGLKALAQSVD